MELSDGPSVDGFPHYLYNADVTAVIDGDTFDVDVDLGFQTSQTMRVRMRDIDTAETHFVDHDSDEYALGTEHAEALREWVQSSRTSDDHPFIFYSEQYETGVYGRVIGDVWSKEHEQWASRYLYNNFDGVELYE